MRTRQASTMVVTAIGLAGLSCTTTPDSAATWTDGTLRFEVRTEGEAELGRYLLLEQHTEGRYTVHSRIPVDLPENWRVRDMRLVDHRLEIVLTDDRTFALDPVRLAALQRAIFSGEHPKPDEELDALWARHAR